MYNGQIGLLFSNVYIGSITFELPTNRQWLTPSATYCLNLLRAKAFFDKFRNVCFFALLQQMHTYMQLVARCVRISIWHLRIALYLWFVSDIAIFVLKRDVKLQLTNYICELNYANVTKKYLFNSSNEHDDFW